MVNRKISHVPASAERIDDMSRAMETRSYKQALMGERAIFATPASTPPFGLISNVSPSLGPSMTNSPLTSPFKEPSRSGSTFLTPSMTKLVNGIPSGTTSTRSSSSSTSVTSTNPHINPLIFDTPGALQNPYIGSPSTVCTSPDKNLSPSKKRRATVLDLDSDLVQEEEWKEDGDLPDACKPKKSSQS
ncbi:hypothetical protein DFH28DRAFT_907814 [Melampsora americana]|nr:hypothetical protein DFH28DRAFT_907814 [Melampsora americana]